MYKVSKQWLSILLVFVMTVSSFVFAEGPNDPAPVINPSGTPNGLNVLFDNAHGQTAGAADWVIDGAFSDFANALAARGYQVNELRKASPMTLSDLQNYDVFVIPEANIPFKTSEQAAIVDYVKAGGSVFFISDHYNADRNKNRWDASEVFNGYRRGAYNNPTKGMSTEEANSNAMQNVVGSDWLAQNFGVRFRYNAIGDVTANVVVTPNQAFNITDGVSGVAVHAGSTVAIIDPTIAKGIVYLPTTSTKWNYAVDQGVYNNGNIAEGPFVAVSKLMAGKAAFIGDSSPVEDASPKYRREENGGSKRTYDGFNEVDDAKLLVQLIDWLATKESYTSFNQVSGLQLDSPTQLASWETPANSTEPQHEPWSAPDVNYKWYDSSTFVSGSYGYQSSSNPDNPDDSTNPGNSTTKVFISEYLEGSSYNKALEIYNGSDSAIDLSTYSIVQSNNNTPIRLSGTLNPGSCYVLAHQSASTAIKDKANQLTGQIFYNGDDQITLKSGSTSIDVVGQAGNSFGKDVILRRNADVTTGNTTYRTSEWSRLAMSDLSDLGQHTSTVAVNHAPVVNQVIGAQTLVEGDTLSLSLANTFSDQDGDNLSYRLSVDDTTVINATLSGNNLNLTAGSAGNTTVTLTADDGNGGTVDTTFDVQVDPAPTNGGNGGVFLSEYIEGSSYNKALEIYNGTSQTIDLSNYTIKQSNAGGAIQLHGTLAPQQVFVLAHARANSTIKGKANMTTEQIIYNGNDKITLLHNNSPIDVIGTTARYFAKDKTLVRKANIQSGQLDYDASQWDVYPKNNSDHLGVR